MHNITVRNEAFSGNDGEIVLLLQKRSSLTTTFSNIDQRISEGIRPISVKAVSINTILCSLDGPVALLKIDCEGAEYDIFDTIDHANILIIRQITMELHAVDGRSEGDIIEKLTRFGFTVRNRYPMLTAIKN